MTPEDIIGKEFKCFAFEPFDSLLKDTSRYKELVGKTGIVSNIHDEHPQYAYVKVLFDGGKTEHWHYPTQMIIDQIEFNNMSIEEINNYIKQLILKIWYQKM